MTRLRAGVWTLVVTSLAFPLQAQTPETSASAARTALACAPPAVRAASPIALRILGTQDTVPRSLMAPQDLVVIGGGTQAGIRLGQQFYVRRGAAAYGARSRGSYMSRSETGTTGGWLRIVAVSDTTALASLEHLCDAIFVNDYLEAFEPPALPEDSDRDEPIGELDFTSPARVVSSAGSRSIAAAGDYVIVDRGRDHGIEPGARLAIYRDLRVAGMPLTSLGEAVVISSAQTSAVVRIARSRDAVFAGDYVVPRKRP